MAVPLRLIQPKTYLHATAPARKVESCSRISRQNYQVVTFLHFKDFKAVDLALATCGIATKMYYDLLVPFTPNNAELQQTLRFLSHCTL